jgi:hypothetical protein
MALLRTRMATSVVRAWTARVAACCLLAIAPLARAQDASFQNGSIENGPVENTDEQLPEPPVALAPAVAAPLMPELDAPSDDASESDRQSAARVMDPHAADFDPWRPLVERPESLSGEPMAEPFSSFDQSQAEFEEAPGESDLRPFDWLRHWGFHHSSTEGPFLDRNVPMERTSWLNRPYHVDAFVGPLLSTGPVDGRVEQENDVLGGIRVGWDFDYYWGIEWRYAQSDPSLIATDSDGSRGDELSGTYRVSDIDFVYYPWGDTKVRPFVQWGLGVTQIGSVRADGSGQEATLLTMPFGAGVQFPITRWLAWRMEVVDNLAFGGDGVDTMNNFTFTAGIDMRFGARPNSYWPWRSSRTIW